MAATRQIGVRLVPASLVKAAKQQAKAEKTFISALWIKAMERYLEAVREPSRTPGLPVEKEDYHA